MEKKSDLPIIHMNLDTLFTKNSNKLLVELLEIFIEETPKIQAEINRAYQLQEQQKLDELLHKLYGSCVYCGLLRLKASLIALKENAANHNYSKELLEKFNKEIKSALDQAKEITKL